MTLLSLKDDMKKIARDHCHEKASPIFMRKAFSIIEESSDDKENLLAEADRIGKIINKGQGIIIYNERKSLIDKTSLMVTRS